MRYYQCDKYPIEFVVAENIDKHFNFHNHVRHYIVSVVMQGTVIVCLENKEAACYEGDMFIIPPYVVHSVRLEKDMRLLSMCIGTAFIKETDREKTEGIVKDLLQNVIAQGIFGKEQGEKLLDSVCTVYRHWDSGPKEMDAGIKILADKMTDHPEQELLIETLAADIFVSKYYFIRKFKNNIGMTPRQFCIQNRIRKSQRLLDGGKSISGIAAEMGFYDQSHYDKAFQRIVGISPSEYAHSQKKIEQGT